VGPGRFLSTLPGVVRVPLRGGPVEVVAELERKVPDGITFDSEGGIYVACYSPDEIFRISPGGEVELVADDWERVVLAAPTNVAFCGPHLDVLVVASLGRWHLSKTRAPVPGQAYNYPKL
jgi:gluconolactonase